MKFLITLDFLDYGSLTGKSKASAIKQLQHAIRVMFESGNAKTFFRQQNEIIEIKEAHEKEEKEKAVLAHHESTRSSG